MAAQAKVFFAAYAAIAPSAKFSSFAFIMLQHDLRESYILGMHHKASAPMSKPDRPLSMVTVM